MSATRIRLFAILALGLVSSPAAAAVLSAAGPDIAAIQGQVDAYRALLGNPNNGNAAGPILTGGRREINWDGAGAAVAAAPANFGTTMTTFQNRGAVFTTPGTGFQISGSDGAPGVVTATEEFGNLNPTYPGIFKFFSEPKLFSPLGSNIMDALFFIPGSSTPAAVSGFGAVFTDVDLVNQTSLAFFGPGDAPLGTFFVPAADDGLSFVGVFFNTGEQVTRVRITTGNAALLLSGSPNDTDSNVADVVAMDDFIFAEPRAVAIPEPAPFALLGLGAAALLGFSRRKLQ
jgi:hypothetical protein